MSSVEHPPLSAVLRAAADRPGRISVGELMDRFGGRAMGAVLLVFALLCTLPLPPGGTTVFGAPLLLLSPQLAFGRRTPWLPKAWRARSIATADLRRSLPKALTWIERVESVSRPRLTVLFAPAGERLMGAICTVLAMVLILPIPLGNMLPAAAASVLAFALVQRDGVLALLGYGLTVLSAGVLMLAFGLISRTAQHLFAIITAA